MRIIIFALILFSCLSKKKEDKAYIKIEHIGPHDKPISTLIISVEELPKNEWEKVVTVDSQSLAKIQAFVSDIKIELRLELRQPDFGDAWGAFKTTSHSAQGDLIFTTLTKAESITFFSMLSEQLQKIESENGLSRIRHELDILRNRIK